MQPSEEQERIERLVDQVKDGDTDAFGEIYDHFFPKIYKYVFYKSQESDVDDLVAQVFIKAWSKIKTYKRTDCSFSSWIFRIAHNTVIDSYRTRKRTVELEEYHPDENERLDPAFLTNQRFDSNRVQRALRSLDDKYQQVIVLKFLQDLPNKDIAQIMNLQETSVRTLQFRALRFLRSYLEDEELRIRRKLEPEVKPLKKPGYFSVRKWFTSS